MGRSGSPLRAHERLFRRGYGGRPRGRGLLGAISLHAPFLAAAVLNGLNLLLGCFLMQESHKGKASTDAL